MSLRLEFHSSISAIDAAAWDLLCAGEGPQLTHAFLATAESTHCVSPETGWQPCHLALWDGNQLAAAVPLYQKSHSWGEFVFDWSWADAYQRAGLNYYPKIVSATPFTPARARKLLARAGDDYEALRSAAAQALVNFAKELNFSSLHLQFIHEDERAVLEQAGFLLRRDCQFHWHNNHYQNFENYLQHFASKKRKNVNRERRRIRESGIVHRHLAGAQLSDEDLTQAWRLCRYTFIARGHEPYLSLEFFRRLHKTSPSTLLVILAELDDKPVAAAICFKNDSHLYGRYWGCEGDFHSLHFETCYYQGIDYCIEHQLTCFEPGTQGEHKVSRGFLPTDTYSAHWLAHPQFADAIGNYLRREGEGVEQYMRSIDSHSPFKTPAKNPSC